MSDLANIIINNNAVISLTELKMSNLSGIISERIYSDVYFDVVANTDRGIVYPGQGGIFELRFPSFDIEGRVV